MGETIYKRGQRFKIVGCDICLPDENIGKLGTIVAYYGRSEMGTRCYFVDVDDCPNPNRVDKCYLIYHDEMELV